MHSGQLWRRVGREIVFIVAALEQLCNVGWHGRRFNSLPCFALTLGFFSWLTAAVDNNRLGFGERFMGPNLTPAGLQ